MIYVQLHFEYRGMGERASGLGERASGLGERASGLGERASGMGERASGLGERASGMGERASGLGERASGLGERASGMGERASGMGERASGLRHTLPSLFHQCGGHRLLFGMLSLGTCFPVKFAGEMTHQKLNPRPCSFVQLPIPVTLVQLSVSQTCFTQTLTLEEWSLSKACTVWMSLGSLWLWRNDLWPRFVLSEWV